MNVLTINLDNKKKRIIIVLFYFQN